MGGWLPRPFLVSLSLRPCSPFSFFPNPPQVPSDQLDCSSSIRHEPSRELNHGSRLAFLSLQTSTLSSLQLSTLTQVTSSRVEATEPQSLSLQ
ncbi:hypothetical protein AFLA_006529 [Aspergillus flavus NRRL3357]|nr:hypothetical protein AFLA_006529 [Aspergillus flavus NRRL3357]